MKKAASDWRPFFIPYQSCFERIRSCVMLGKWPAPSSDPATPGHLLPRVGEGFAPSLLCQRKSEPQRFFFFPSASAVFLKPLASCVPSVRARASVTRSAQ
ncbi:hypothetical protein EDE12_101722 [Methylosinus sp. sav-2]|nr:hypothetical protein EDE12_101722 [Methylosinus sp. sav-2]